MSGLLSGMDRRWGLGRILRVWEARWQQQEATATDRWLALEREIGALRDENRWLRESLAGQERLLTGLLERIATTTDQVERLAGATLGAVNASEMQRSHEAERTRAALGRIEERQLGSAPGDAARQYAFSVFSQSGEDGFIAHLVGQVPLSRPYFVEFGVEDYREANTRWLLQRRGWSGLVMDGSQANMAALRAGELSFRHDLTGVAAWVTRENINELLRQQRVPDEIGLLSIDIDGNDYWVWEAITATRADIVVVEYNYRFGAEIAAVVPYAPDFVKEQAHPAAIYYGASLAALVRLGAILGYDFVGCSESGVNAFFVRRDRRPASIPAKTAQEGFVAGRHAEWRDTERGTWIHGRPLRRASLEEELALLLALPLVRFEEAA